MNHGQGLAGSSGLQAHLSAWPAVSACLGCLCLSVAQLFVHMHLMLRVSSFTACLIMFSSGLLLRVSCQCPASIPLVLYSYNTVGLHTNRSCDACCNSDVFLCYSACVSPQQLVLLLHAEHPLPMQLFISSLCSHCLPGADGASHIMHGILGGLTGVLVGGRIRGWVSKVCCYTKSAGFGVFRTLPRQF